MLSNDGPLKLSDDNPLVVAAREAEERLYEAYGLAARTHYVLLPGRDIRVRVSEIGKGPPLLIVPGNTGDAFPLASLMSCIHGRRIFAVNRPGGGLSDGMDHRTVDIRSFAIETLTTVLDALDLRQVDVVAHSMGAHWSLWLAMDKPERVRRLVMLGNPGNVMKGGAPLVLRLMAKPLFNRLVSRFLTPSKSEDALRPLRMMGHKAVTLETLPQALADSYFHFRRLPHYLISASSMMQNAAPSLGTSDLARVAHPVALLWGTEDTFAGVDVGRSIARALPHGEFHSLTGAGHLPWLESPETCGRLILKFLGNQ